MRALSLVVTALVLFGICQFFYGLSGAYALLLAALGGH